MRSTVPLSGNDSLIVEAFVIHVGRPKKKKPMKVAAKKKTGGRMGGRSLRRV